MIRLEAVPRDPLIRTWCVFFCDAERYSWWDVFTRKGFRHVAAAGFSAELGVWIVFDPTRAGIRFELYAKGDPALDLRLGEMLHWSGRRYYRVPAGEHRARMPLLFGCLGGLKALLGVRCGALTPHGLYRHLIATGAEPVTVPQHEDARVETVWRRQRGHSDGGPQRGGAAPARAAAR